ncbi:hypothetical protein C499_15055 [Halogeometricum borinquense DSM 11551]|uniref:Uncharacterized protein n=2 Tax=Halogeometricum borinquense TaxID=60847 RepID=E4NTS4_HALBP|nr:hypothetical protein [Halogeometricum borinquense]ADQ68229.1 hypothetical protein Hbor_26770 [Halogeometricum borinquense DSM 11551]ELY24727.1 hypothetical protein C499_15055 [Halogeometricum borinquense DSM 11551]RYJ12876.1 hypothetical protein ELS19_02100 [Halogeometricum borinquense]
MATWLNPRDGDADAWAGQGDEPSRPPRIPPTLERAHEVSAPYQFSEARTYYGTLTGVEFDGDEYPSTEVKVVGGVTRGRTLKLHVRGFLWRPNYDDGPNAYRFKSQVVREQPPTETIPFDTYQFWQRTQRGTVTNDGVIVEFEPEEGTEQTVRTDQGFDELFEPLRIHIAELELVRNPQLASYVLRETDRWDAYGDVFRWRPSAFNRREVS